MPTPILATKLNAPSPKPNLVSRPRLLERLNQGKRGKLSLVSAPAGFGKTTLVGEWIGDCGRPAAWLSLDEGDSDPARFLTYLVASLQTMSPGVGAGVLPALQSPQPASTESILTALVNDVSAIPEDFFLVLDDYHATDSRPVDNILGFLLEHQPARMHVIIITREDPSLPLARWRASGQLTEVRAADLRFEPAEAEAFLIQAMGLNLPTEAVLALASRTGGWIAGLQLAAISIQGRKDAAGFLESFTGSHRFVMDYLVEEVLQQQPERTQAFLLRTSILQRLCGPLCDAVLDDVPGAGQQTLEHLERANLFVVPLDNERHWYRYHHLFADLLRQRLRHNKHGDKNGQAAMHARASQWFEDNDLEIEAFRHAVAAGDVGRAVRLIAGRGTPLQFRGAAADVLRWLESLPAATLDARPSLWVTYASALSISGQHAVVEQKLRCAEAALHGADMNGENRNLIGHIAGIRAMLAAGRHQVDVMIAQSRRALEYLHPTNLSVRTATTWKLGYAYHIQGDRDSARQAYADVVSTSRASGNLILDILGTSALGTIQEGDTQLHEAAESYRYVLRLAGDPPQPTSCEAYLGMARILYEWNDLDAAQEHGRRAVELASQFETVDTHVPAQLFLARLRLARGDMDGAKALLAEADRSARKHDFQFRLPDLVTTEVSILLRGGRLVAATRLAQKHDLPLSLARGLLARGDAPAALATLERWRRKVEDKGWHDELLRALILLALARDARRETDAAVAMLAEALALAQPGGYVRAFVDEGGRLARLLTLARANGILPAYVDTLLAAFDAEAGRCAHGAGAVPATSPAGLVEPLSEREREVLRLVAQGLSNREICDRLHLALSTVKGHNRTVFDKLQVRRRTEAVARARELGLL